jgi:hypothetical protein
LLFEWDQQRKASRDLREAFLSTSRQFQTSLIASALPLPNMFNIEQTQICHRRCNVETGKDALGKRVRGEINVFHLLWYIVIGLFSGVIANL